MQLPKAGDWTYGAYDLTDPDNMCELMLPFLERFVLPAGLRTANEPER